MDGTDTLDVLFLHVPRFAGGRREVMVVPTGLVGLANLLADRGRRVELVHLGLESEAAGGFSLREHLEARSPRIVALSLHWALQTRAVVDVAERVRRWAPGARVVLGGLTASVFARQLAALPFVDAVVRGDGEGPLLALADSILEGDGRLDRVPNLVYPDRCGRVVETPWSFVLDEGLAARLRHGSLAAMRRSEAYLSRALYADFAEGAPGSEGYPGAAFLNAGRGCSRECLCCGGAASAQLLTSARAGVLLYPLGKLVRDGLEAWSEGARALRTSFDPPGGRRRVVAWLRRLLADGMRFRVLFDLWELPSRALLDVLAHSAPGSTAIYSPECGAERVRRLVRPRSFSNEALLRSLGEAEDRGLRTHVFLSAGLPGERAEDVDETVRLVERIRRETRAAVSATPMAVDPASPLWQEPARHGVRLVRSTLRDFHDETGLPGGPGYETEHLDEAGILAALGRVLEAAGLPPPAGRPGLRAAGRTC